MALLNWPPGDYMSPEAFRHPLEPWADASSSDRREDENNETQSGNEQALPAKYDSDTRQREYLRQRSELWGEAESTSNVDETEDDRETVTEDDDSEGDDSEGDDSEDDDSEDDDSEDDDSEDSDSEIIDPLNYISGIPIDDSEDDDSEDEGSEDDGSEDDDSEDEGSEDEGSEDEGSEDEGSEDEGSEDDDSEIIDPLDHISGIPIDKWADASCRPSFLLPIWISTIQSLLITSRQIREEVLDILYGENLFRVTVGKYSCERALRNGFSKAKMQRMRHIMILYEQLSSSSDDGPEFRLDRNIWDKVLPNLSTLQLVLSQPKEEVYIHRRDCRRSVAQMKMVWMKEVPPILAYLCRTLSQTATIMVDVDMWKVTSDLLDKFLGRNWSHVRTTTGDTLFQRSSTLHHESKWTDEIFDDFPIGCECVPYEEVDSELEYGLDLAATWEDDHGDYDPDNVPGSYFYSPRWTE